MTEQLSAGGAANANSAANPASLTHPMFTMGEAKVSPKTLLLYGPPKSGKTAELVKLAPEILIVNFDAGGVDPYAVNKIDCVVSPMQLSAEVQKMDEVSQQYYLGLAMYDKQVAARQAVVAKANTDKKLPFKYIALDSLTGLFDAAAAQCMKEYLLETGYKWKGKDKDGNPIVTDVRDLPHGLGHGKVRDKMKHIKNQWAAVTKRLIMTAHLKDKLLDGAGKIIQENEIALDGKLGMIMAAHSDAIGRVYYKPGLAGAEGQTWVSFKTNANQVKGAGSRYKGLAGQDIPLEWDKIFLD